METFDVSLLRWLNEEICGTCERNCPPEAGHHRFSEKDRGGFWEN